MSVISDVILIALFIINLLATLYSGIVVATIYDKCNGDLVSSAYAIAYGIILVLTLKLTEYNINLAILLVVVALIANIIAAKLAVKFDYKRNVKPYLRIKF